MQSRLVWTGIAALALGGCAGANRSASGPAIEPGSGDLSPLRFVAARSLDSRVQPMVPVHLAAEGGDVAVTFGRRGRQQVTTRLDPGSLELLSSTPNGQSEAPAAPASGAARVDLESGRFIVCWTHENADGGRQAMAQMWTQSGSRVGPPLVISAPDADVLGAPRATTTDGRHVLVTFAASTGKSFELRAVSLEDADHASDLEQTARR
jgi:hypothetical protein